MLAGCARPERAMLEAFFDDSRLRDLTALQRYSRITFEPLQQGIVTDFDIVNVVQEGEAKTVSVSADVKRPDGQIVRETLVLMLERRAVPGGTSGTAPREWIITGLLEKPH